MTETLCDFGDNGLCVRCGHKSAVNGLLRHCVIVMPQDNAQKPSEVPTLADLSYDGHVINADSLPSPAVAFGVPHGPGTELKKILAKVGITATPDCSCNARAAEMDRQGVEWCEANLDTIVGWLREQAEARGLPFLGVAGRMLVRRAISNARKAVAAAGT
jgi:hypothetical protein